MGVKLSDPLKQDSQDVAIFLTVDHQLFLDYKNNSNQVKQFARDMWPVNQGLLPFLINDIVF